MKIFILTILAIVLTVVINAKDYQKEFEKYKQKYNKTDKPDKERFENFKRNYDLINNQIEKFGKYCNFGQNKFTDKNITQEIFVRARAKKYPATTTKSTTKTTVKLTTSSTTTTSTTRASTSTNASTKSPTVTTSTTRSPTSTSASTTTSYVRPQALDWRTLNVVTPPKDQGYCGSCWAFSAVGAIESFYAKNKNQFLDLAEQNAVDCITTYPCDGWYVEDVFTYTKNNGLMNETVNPYTAVKGTCQFSLTKVAAKINGYNRLTGTEAALEDALINFGPISVLVEASNNWGSYSSGVLPPTACGTSLNHAVLAVGFNNTAVPPYWIIKNSWGTDWGEDGYIRLEKGKGACGIGSYNLQAF